MLDWAIDDISFFVMDDPVIVSILLAMAIRPDLSSPLILTPSRDKNRQVIQARLLS